MQNFGPKITCLFLLSFCSCLVFSQTLPDEMKISEDGKRLTLGGNASEGFYDEANIRTIEFNFDQSNYWTLLTNNYDSSTDLMASITIDGETIDSVGIRFKGATSYRRNESEKKSFNVSMNFLIDGQDFMGYETFNLNGNYDDPSSIREILFNHVGRNYTPALKTNFVQLKINGVDWGPYAHVQQLNGEYLKEWFLSNDGTRWRALQETTAGPGGGGGGPGGGGNTNRFGQGLSTMNYLGEDTLEYIPNYTLKRTEKNQPWGDLIRGTDMLNNLATDNDLYDKLKNHVDIDKALWFLAHEIIFADEDSYVWKGGMDYYVYWEAETGRLVPLEYDGNSCMILDATNWSPFYNESNTNFPLMNRLFASPDLRQRYLAHFRTILADHFNPEKMNALIDNYKNQISDLIANDSKKIYTFSQFESEIEELKEFVAQRSDYLLNHAEVNVQGLSITEVNTDKEFPFADDVVQVQTKIDGDLEVDQVRLYYGTGLVGTFERVTMTDSGNGVFTADIPAFTAGTHVRYYVEAIADNASKTATFMPKGAEHDVYFYRVSLGDGNLESDIVVNEFMASNDATIADQDGEFDDWIELYNKSAETVDISGYFLSDNPDNLGKYQLPDGTSIAADGYLIVWADEDGSQEGLHANFKLSASGEEIYLLDPDTIILDQVFFGEQTTDLSSARIPNGVGDFVKTNATFGAFNEATTSSNEVVFDRHQLAAYPNPAKETLFVVLQDESQEIKNLELFDLYGRLLKNYQPNTSQVQISIADLSPGMYVLIVNGTMGQKIIIQK